MINFLIAFGFSFIGSIPPGAINISVVQYTIEGNLRAAVRFSIAAALIEFPYVITAILFSEILLSTTAIMDNIKLISTVLMFVLAIINTYSYFKPNPISKHRGKGFRKGVLISIFNPLAIPFWTGVTAYLLDQKWITINTAADYLFYGFGVSIGTLTLLILLIWVTRQFKIEIRNQKLSKLIPACVFYILGFYGLYQLL